MRPRDPYIMPGLPPKDVLDDKRKRRLTQIIAEAWNIPEDKVLGCTEFIDTKHPSPSSSRGQRLIVPGERRREYSNARKFYFYVMIMVKHYSFTELRKLTGRKIASIKYNVSKAQTHMDLEREYMIKAQFVLDYIRKDQVIFPKPILTFEANATVIERGGVHEATPDIPLSGQDIGGLDEHRNHHEDRIGNAEGTD